MHDHLLLALFGIPTVIGFSVLLIVGLCHEASPSRPVHPALVKREEL